MFYFSIKLKRRGQSGQAGKGGAPGMSWRYAAASKSCGEIRIDPFY